MMFDVAVVGAGPAGLMAANTAAENGLKAVLIEKQKDISRIKRACCMQFIMDEDYEGETIRIEDGRVVFPRNGFTIDYAGPLIPLAHKYYVSPRGHTIHFAYPDMRPIIIKFDKGQLLTHLLHLCEKAGVEVRNETVAYAAEDGPAGVAVKTRSRGVLSVIRAKKLISADGVNARIAESLGMNRLRNYFTTARGASPRLRRARASEPGGLAEGASTNLFVVTEGTFLTPPLSAGILPGITRAVVIEVLAGLGLPCHERPLPLDTLLAADEAFMTSTTREVVPVRQVDDSPIGDGRPGPYTCRLMDAFHARAPAHCGQAALTAAAIPSGRTSG